MRPFLGWRSGCRSMELLEVALREAEMVWKIDNVECECHGTTETIAS